MSDVKELEKRIAAREARRAELAGQLEEAEAKVRKARQSFVEGGEDRKLMQAQLRLGAVREALEGLDEELEDLRVDLEGTAAAAERERKIARLVELAGEARDGLAAYNAARREANKALFAMAERLLAERYRIREARRQFLQLVAQVAPGARQLMIGKPSSSDGALKAEVAALEAELLEIGADLRVVCDFGFSATRRPQTTLCRHSRGLVEEVHPFGGQLADAMNVLARERDRDARRAQEAEIQGAIAG